jgi:hypothetical protein
LRVSAEPKRRSSAASNPWDCSDWSRALPRPEVSGAEVLWRLARLLYQWPDAVPLHQRSEEVRRRRLIEAIAGYPELPGGGHPFDQPFHPRLVAAARRPAVPARRDPLARPHLSV